MSIAPLPEPLVINPSYRQALARFEKEYFGNLLKKHEWNVAAVAKEAAVNYHSLAQRLEDLGLRKIRRYYKQKVKLVRTATG